MDHEDGSNTQPEKINLSDRRTEIEIEDTATEKLKAE